MTTIELTKRNAEMSARISALTDQIHILEKDISRFKNNVSADIKRLLSLINQEKK